MTPPTAVGSGDAVLRLESGRGAIPRARHWVVDRARDLALSPGDVATIELLTSEVVTNAVRHGSGATITVHVDAVAGACRVGVTDASDALPVVRATGPRVPGGQGMRLIERLAADWGVAPVHGGGKTVWFAVPLDR